MLRGKQVDEQIILMMEAYLELYHTLNFHRWLDYGTKDSCRMCKLVGIDENYKTDCRKCPLWKKGSNNFPCFDDDADDTGFELEKLIMRTLSEKNVTKRYQRKVIKDRIKFLYDRLKVNGYFK